MKPFKLPGIPAAVSQVLLHVVVVFASTFGAQLVAGATGNLHGWPTLAALATSAALAGVVAAAHYVLGLIPANASTNVIVDAEKIAVGIAPHIVAHLEALVPAKTAAPAVPVKTGAPAAPKPAAKPAAAKTAKATSSKTAAKKA